MNSSLLLRQGFLPSDLPLNSLNTNTMQHQQRRHHRLLSSNSSSIIDSHLVNLYAQLAALEQQQPTSPTLDSTRLKALLDAYHYSRLYLEARCKTEKERINRRFDAETRCTHAQFAAKKSELKEILLDRLRRKRKLVVEEMRSVIDIHSHSFDADPLLVTMQPPHPLQAKAYNFRQRPDMGQPSSSGGGITDDDFASLTSLGNGNPTGILSPILPQQAARKRLVGAFSLFQLPKWTVRDDECEDDIRSILTSRK